MTQVEASPVKGPPTVDDVIGIYVKLRAKKQRLEAELKEQTKAIDAQMNKLEAWLQMKMAADGVNSFNTDMGTAYKTTVEQASVADMDAFVDYVRKNEAWHLLEKRVSKTGVRSMLDEGIPLPSGVNWYTSTAIHIRKPSER